MKKVSSYSKLVFAFFFGLTFMSVNGQDHDGHDDDKHEFKHFRIAMSIGHGYIPTATKQDASFLVLPTWGVDFQYWRNEKWAIGFKGDLEIANYIIDDKDNENQLERESPLILTTPIFYSPWEENGVVFLMGPGVELEGDHDFFVVRMGVGYEMHLPRNWDVAPEVIYDLKGGYVNSFTLAIGIGRRF